MDPQCPWKIDCPHLPGLGVISVEAEAFATPPPMRRNFWPQHSESVFFT